jgi:hypothetical protein
VIGRAAIALCLIFAVVEMVAQARDTAYVAAIARDALAHAGANDVRSRVIALRDYLRSHVHWQGVPQEGRPFLRDSAADTLRSGEGYCGEVTRAFIVMAAQFGIRAQRINLWGAKDKHVVAEVELAPGRTVLVDSQSPPQIKDLETLDDVMLRKQYDDYYTLNLRRLHISWLVSRVKLEMGAFTFWTENPHVLTASLWLGLGVLLSLLKGLRSGFRYFLRRRGWIHVTSLDDDTASDSAKGAHVAG